MLQHTTLQGMNTGQLEQLRRQINLDFLAPDTSNTMRDELCKNHDIVSNCLPHSFVLASLFDVESMTSDIPEDVYESDPSLEWVTCSCCDGSRFVEVEGNPWIGALFADPRCAYAHRHLNKSFKACGRCNGSGEVLDLATHPEISEYTPIPSLPKLTKPLARETQSNGWTTPVFDDPICGSLGEISSTLHEKYESYEKCFSLEPILLTA